MNKLFKWFLKEQIKNITIIVWLLGAFCWGVVFCDYVDENYQQKIYKMVPYVITITDSLSGEIPVTVEDLSWHTAPQDSGSRVDQTYETDTVKWEIGTPLDTTYWADSTIIGKE